jgi:hypothetical protein
MLAFSELLVHRSARRRGLAPDRAHAAYPSIRRPGSAAERLYIRLGWTKYGEITAYATSPDGRSRDPVSFFYKMLWPRA